MSDTAAEQTPDTPADETPAETTIEPAKGSGYSVTDLPEGAKPDPLGDASLSAQERATATPDE